MINLKKISMCLILSFVFGNFCTVAQVGINTETPLSDLDVRSTDNKIVLNVKDSSDKSLLHIDSLGRMSTNSTDYPIKVDLRNDQADNYDHSLGVGYTESEASVAGKGAIRYNPTSKTLEFSNSSTWVPLSKGINRIFVLAQNKNGFKLRPLSGVIASTIERWDTISDDAGCFDADYGIFTAPKDGIYAMSVTAVIENIPSSSSVMKYELILSNPDQPDQGLKSVVTYFGGTGTSQLANTCKTIFYLTKGQEVTAGIYLTNGSAANLTTDGSLNTFTIVEM